MKSPAFRLISLLLISAMLLSALIGCGSKFNNSNSTTESADQSNDQSNNNSGSSTETHAIGSTMLFYEDLEYYGTIICAESPSPLDVIVYEAVVELFYDLTGVMPETATDADAQSGERCDEYAILIGTTAYKQSKDENAKLKNAYGANATLLGNTYVLTYSDAHSAETLLKMLKSNLDKYANEDKIKLDNNWGIILQSDGTVTDREFDESSIEYSATLPDYNGAPLSDPLYAGQQSNIYIQKNATLEDFNNYCYDLHSAGFLYYTDNSINDNKFATYVTKTQIVNVMYFKNQGEVRIAVDNRGTGTNAFDLPTLSCDNDYIEITDPSLTMVEIDNTGYGGGMCFIYKLSNGKFFVVDSGVNASGSRTSSAKWIYKTLVELEGDDEIVVAGWLITHVHSDHLGGLYDMASDSSITSKLTIEQLIHNEPADAVTMDLDNLNANSANTIWKWMNPIINAFNITSVIKAHPGQVLHYADLKVTVLTSQDVTLDQQSTLKDSNELSVVTQMDFNGKKILMLADAEKAINAFLEETYEKALKSDILQVAHHGLNNSGADPVNRLCDPDIALWPAGYDVSGNRDKYEMSLNWEMNAFLKDNVTNYGAIDGNITFDKNWKKQANWTV